MAEVCSVVDVSQFSPGKSVEKCGFYSVSLLKHAGKSGQAPNGSVQDVASWADAKYVEYDGPDLYSNEYGMTVAKEYQLIQEAGLHYQAIGALETGFHPERLTANYIRAWLKHDYPLILAIKEDNVIDLDLGAKPYAWDTTGYNHIITCTGFEESALLCHDTANVDANGVRPGPRRYDAERLQVGMLSATVVVLPWLQRPSPDFDPTKENNVMPIPTNWRDDGTRLIAPNGHYFKAGFRNHVLQASSWDTNDVPLEEEQQVAQVELHSNRGAGSRQLTANHLLVWTEAIGVKESACGQEIARCYNVIADLEKQIATLKTSALSASTANVTDAVAALHTLETNAMTLKNEVDQAIESLSGASTHARQLLGH